MRIALLFGIMFTLIGLFFIFTFRTLAALIWALPFAGIGFLCIHMYITKKKKDNLTQKKGELCYARIIDCYSTGSFELKKKEYGLVAVVYVPSLQKTVMVEDTMETINENEYEKDMYVSVQYYNNDINVIRKVYPEEMSDVERDILTNDSVIEEYKKQLEEREKKEEIPESQLQEQSKQVEKIGKTINKVQEFIMCIAFYFFSFYLLIIEKNYLKKVLECLKNFPSNLPSSIILPSVLLINLAIPITIFLLKEKSFFKGFLGFLWFATIFYMFAFS